MPNQGPPAGGEWLEQLGMEMQGMADWTLFGHALKYITEVGRGPAFLAWLRAQKEKEHRGR